MRADVPIMKTDGPAVILISLSVRTASASPCLQTLVPTFCTVFPLSLFFIGPLQDYLAFCFCFHNRRCRLVLSHHIDLANNSSDCRSQFITLDPVSDNSMCLPSQIYRNSEPAAERTVSPGAMTAETRDWCFVDFCRRATGLPSADLVQLLSASMLERPKTTD